MMTKKEMQELATIVSQAVVEAMKATSAKPVSANKGRKSATPNEGNKAHKPYSGNVPEVSEQTLLLEAKGKKTKKATAHKYSTDLKDYEPKKKGGFYDWASYKAQRTGFCYAYCTGGKALGCFEDGKRVCTFDQIEEEYAEAKKLFEKKYKYVKKADR